MLLRMISCGHYTQLAAAWVRDATCKGAPRNACLKTDSCTQAWQLTVAMQQAAPNCMRSLRPPRGLTRGDTQRSTAAEFELGKRLWPSQTVQGPRERVGCPRSCHANSRQAPALLVQTPSEWPREQKPKLHHLHHPRRPTPVDRDTCFLKNSDSGQHTCCPAVVQLRSWPPKHTTSQAVGRPILAKERPQ